MTNLHDEFNPGRIRWDCRRGIKEADVLLGPFYEQHFESLGLDDKRAFIFLLAQHDVDLFEWFTSRSEPEDPALQRIVGIILAAVRP
jgi:antitoxin CptB